MDKVKIGLIWHNVSSGNLGVSALSIANLILINKACKELGITPEFHTIGDGQLVSDDNKQLVVEQIGIYFSHTTISIRAIVFNPWRLAQYINYISKFDVIFDIGAGDSFSDIYGGKRLAIQAFTKFVSAAAVRKSVLSPQTLGPFNSYKSRVLAWLILKGTRLVFARDSLSFTVGERFGSIHLSTDVAFSLPYNRSNIKNTKLTIGINVSGLLWNGGYTGGNQFGLGHDYREYISNLVKYFVEMSNVEVRLISHVISTTEFEEREDDYLACNKVKEMFPECIVAPRMTNPIVAKNYIAELDYFTGARMHATIAAFSAGVPVTPYAYSRKFKGLYDTIGYNNVLEARQLSAPEAVAINVEHFSNRKDLKNNIIKCNERIQILTDSYVKEVMFLLKS